EAPREGPIEAGADLGGAEREARQVPLDAHEEDLLFHVDVLIEVEDVAVVPEEEIRHGRDDSLAVGTVDEKDRRAADGPRALGASRGFHRARLELTPDRARSLPSRPRAGCRARKRMVPPVVAELSHAR